MMDDYLHYRQGHAEQTKGKPQLCGDICPHIVLVLSFTIVDRNLVYLVYPKIHTSILIIILVTADKTPRYN